MYFDRELCFVFDTELQNVTSGVIGDPIRTGYGQFNGRPVYLAATVVEGELTATGDPGIKFVLEYADNIDFTDSQEVTLAETWSKDDFNSKDGQPCPCSRVPMSPPHWKEPKDIFWRCKIDAEGAIACTGKFRVGIVLDPENWW